MGEADVVVVRDEAELDGAVGDLCSLLPVGGVARGVRTDAMRFRLDDEDLAPGATRGVSNELTAPRATVSVRDGVLVAVLPDARRAGR
jgi:thiamine pyrophosphokinase